MNRKHASGGGTRKQPKYKVRIQRLLAILTAIQGRPRYWSARRLAVEFGVTVRTAFRDIADLRAIGIPIECDTTSPDAADHGYFLGPGYLMKPVELDLHEALALITLAQHVAESEQMPLTRAAASAVTKIRSQLPAKTAQALQEMDRHIAVRLPPMGPHEGFDDVVERVRWSIARRRALRCRYEGAHNPNGHTDRFEFHPYAMLFARRAWYVVGHHGGHGEVRTLKLNRFSLCETTDRPYVIPDDFSLEKHLGLAWSMMRGERHDVAIGFDKAFAETISDTQWHATQSFDLPAEDGSVVFRCEVDGLDEIVWWVLSMGPHAKVLEPAELAAMVKQYAERTAELYEGAR